jgi:hypothetical protein
VSKLNTMAAISQNIQQRQGALQEPERKPRRGQLTTTLSDDRKNMEYRMAALEEGRSLSRITEELLDGWLKRHRSQQQC